MSPDVSVVVVSYNSARHLEALLPDLADPRLEVVVVDNASVDDSCDVVRRFPFVRLVDMGRNSGWTEGSNAGADLCRAQALAFVNPDARPTAEDLLALAAGLRPGVASVSPEFVDDAGDLQSFGFRFPDPVRGLLLFFTAGQRLDRLTGSRALRRRTYQDAGSDVVPDHVGAACLVVSRRVFEVSGGFDTSMWLFFSDTDWAVRQRRAGLVHAIETSVRVPHAGGGSVRAMPPDSLLLVLQRDYLAYASKHYSGAGRGLTVVGAVVLSGFLPMLMGLVRRDRVAVMQCWSRIRDVFA